MGKRIFLAGLLGGISMFLWSFVAHTVLPLGQVGISEIPNESAVLSSMQNTIGTTSGLYMFPGMGAGPNATREQQKAAMQQYDQKLATNPSGLLLYQPPGGKGMTPQRLMTEFGTEFLESLLLAFLLAQTRLVSFGSQLGFIVAAALMATITTNVPYWNWYNFPGNYTTAYMSIEFVAFLVAGIVAALLLGRGVPKASRAAA
jgi:hypothetical protein